MLGLQILKANPNNNHGIYEPMYEAETIISKNLPQYEHKDVVNSILTSKAEFMDLISLDKRICLIIYLKAIRNSYRVPSNNYERNY